ncbi:hypothetical protein BOO88_11700 [Stutzerimonas stutzeri]|nr:hypothetical protein BOO89_07205 [Stutzerimonas stutzeri]AZO89558.1 hypothetical protein BOO88_11700 [Stutzerimonas stutzeri]
MLRFQSAMARYWNMTAEVLQNSQVGTAQCGSEPARDEFEGAVGCQARRVIVDDHREQARSYRGSVY